MGRKTNSFLDGLTDVLEVFSLMSEYEKLQDKDYVIASIRKEVDRAQFLAEDLDPDHIFFNKEKERLAQVFKHLKRAEELTKYL